MYSEETEEDYDDGVTKWFKLQSYACALQYFEPRILKLTDITWENLHSKPSKTQYIPVGMLGAYWKAKL